MLENRVLRRIFGLKRDEVMGGWSKVHNEELRDLYSSPSLIRIIKSIMVKWAGQVEGMEERGSLNLLIGKTERKSSQGKLR
jgi:hypothetical protein